MNQPAGERFRVDPSIGFCIDWLLGAKQVRALFNMLMAGETANSDLPPIGFCKEPLIGSKYAGCQETLTKNGCFGLV